jgi:hypothetical protein
VGGVHYQLIKLAYGALDSATLVSAVNPLPVSDAGGSVTVDGTVELGATSLAALESLTTISTVTTVGAVTAITNALPAGAATIGAVNLAQYTPSSGRLPVELDASALAALETITVASITAPLAAGTNNIGDVDVLTSPGVVTDDAAYTVAAGSLRPVGGYYNSTKDTVDSGDAGVFAMNVRRAMYTVPDNVTSTANSSTANLAGAAVFTGTSEDTTDYALIQVSVFSSHASATDGLSLQQSSDGTNWDITDVYTVAATTAKLISIQPGAKFFRLVYTNGGTLTTSLRIQTLYKVLPSKGSSQRPADATSNENDFEQISAFLHGFNGTTWDRLRSTTANGLAVDVTRVTGTVTTGGAAAHDAGISGNPVRVAGRGRTSDYTSVANDDTTDLLTTLNGKVVTQPFSIPELSWSYAAASGGIVNTTGVTAKAAAAAGIRNYVTRCQVINGHATVDTDVQIRDGAAGTVLWRGFAKAAGGGVACDFDPPLRGTAATLIEVACGTTGTATYFNLQGYTGP